MKISDIDFKGLKIRVSKSSSEAGGQHFKSTKTTAGRRTISISTHLADLLRQRVAIAMKEGSVGTGLLFTSREGTVLRQSNFRNRQWTRLLKKLGIEHRGFHNARHTAATEMLRRHVPIKVVSAILGHTNVETTLRIYAHWIPEDMSNAAETMGSFGLVTAQ